MYKIFVGLFAFMICGILIQSPVVCADVNFGTANCPKCDDRMIKNAVKNPDNKIGIPICGRVSSVQSCLFYVLNSSSYDKVAEDFFDEVATKAGRKIFEIQKTNPSYRKIIIPPGYFAEIIVPALK